MWLGDQEKGMQDVWADLVKFQNCFASSQLVAEVQLGARSSAPPPPAPPSRCAILPPSPGFLAPEPIAPEPLAAPPGCQVTPSKNQNGKHLPWWWPKAGWSLCPPRVWSPRVQGPGGPRSGAWCLPAIGSNDGCTQRVPEPDNPPSSPGCDLAGNAVGEFYPCCGVTSLASPPPRPPPTKESSNFGSERQRLARGALSWVQLPRPLRAQRGSKRLQVSASIIPLSNTCPIHGPLAQQCTLLGS